MVSYLVGLFIGSCVIAVLGLLVFKCMWLSGGGYYLPKSLARLNLEDLTANPRIETRLWTFLYQIVKYIYWADHNVMVEEIGFEQTWYLLFYRCLSTYQLVATLVSFSIVIIWTAITSDTNQGTVVLERLLSSAQENELNTIGFHTFLMSLNSICLGLTCWRFLVRLNQHVTKIITRAETKKSLRRDPSWMQVRTVKISGVHEDDVKGDHLKEVIEAIMAEYKISGKLVKINIIPELYEAVQVHNEIENLEKGFLIAKYIGISTPINRICFRWYTPTLRQLPQKREVQVGHLPGATGETGS